MKKRSSTKQTPRARECEQHGVRFASERHVVDVPAERLTRFIQRLEGLDGEMLSGREEVVSAIERDEDPVFLTGIQKETAFLVLDLWAELEGEATLGPELAELREALAEDLGPFSR
jgi:hypothetical protein